MTPTNPPRRAMSRDTYLHAASPIVVLAAVVVLACNVAADDSHVAVGTRALSLGGAFSAVADDASAPYWNPAGLTGVGHQAFLGEHSWLFGSDVGSDYVSFVLPLTWRQAVALDLHHIGLNEDGLRFGENRFGLSYAANLGKGVSVGATGRLVTRGFELDETSLGEGSGFGLDCGILWNPITAMRLSLSTQDAFDTRIRYSDGHSAIAYRQALHAGASYRLRERVLLCGQVDDRWHAGLEVTALSGLALRAGLERYRENAEGTSFSTGLGLKVGPLSLDYAFLQHPTLPATHSVQLSSAFNFNPPLLRLEDLKTRELYASLHSAYSRDGVGDVRIRNLSDHPVTARLAVSVSGVTQTPTERDVVVRPRDAVGISLPAVLSPDRAMALHEDIHTQVVVTARYASVRLPRTEKISGQTFVFAPGAINWQAGIAQAAAFVTPQDAVAQDLASFACRTPSLSGESQAPSDVLTRTSLGFMACVLDALALLDVSYVPDPNTPYNGIQSLAPHTVDTIHYPWQTLRHRSGDCDDTTVLVAALLESVGIPTQLVDLPGHLLLIADSGELDSQRHRLGVPDSLTVVRDGKVWVPLETTRLRGGFLQAWRDGALQLRQGQPVFVRVDTAWVHYPPTALPNPDPSPVRPDSARLAQRWRAEAAAFRQMRNAHISQVEEQLRQDLSTATSSPDSQIARRESELGTALATGGNLAAAESLFTVALARRPGSTGALIALGNIALLRGSTSEARARYEAAIASDGTVAGGRLNLALALLQEGRKTEAEEQVAWASRLEGSAQLAARLLGLRIPQDAHARGAYSPTTVLQMLSAPEMSLLRLLGVAESVTIRQTAVPSQTPSGAPSGSLLYWPASVGR